ncbi:MAG: BMP family protein [Haloarculaceae archaeon]
MVDSRNRRAFLRGIVASGVGITLAGCTGGGNNTTTNEDGGGDGGDGGDGMTTTAGDGMTTTAGDGSSSQFEAVGDTVNVGMVYSTGGLGDNSFNDMAHRGIKTAKSKLGNVAYTNAEPGSPSEFKTFQRRFATSKSPDYDLIVCVGFSQKSALQKTAPNFPEQRFQVIDTVVDEPNVSSYVFKEHEGSFQCGVLAGMLTNRKFSAGAGETKPDKDTIGFVGGKEIPLIKKFEAGYRFGAKQVNSDINIKSAYSGSWSDPGQGKSIANSMYDDGADIIYHAAGGTGVGVIKAAQQRGRYAIGVDARQSKTLPNYADVILGSMVKQVNEAVFRATKNVNEGEFAGGETRVLGLEKDGVKLMYGVELGDDIPQEIKDKINSLSNKVIEGELSVPSKVKNV